MPSALALGAEVSASFTDYASTDFIFFEALLILKLKPLASFSAYKSTDISGTFFV